MRMSMLFKTLLTMVRDGCERDTRSVMFLSSFCGWRVQHKIHAIWGYISLQRTLKSRNTHKTLMNKQILRTLQVNYRLAYNCHSLQYKYHMHCCSKTVVKRLIKCLWVCNRPVCTGNRSHLLFLNFCSIFLFQIPIW